MITCPNCGAQNDPANRFCDQCGTRLEPAAPVASPAPAVAASVCPSCGAAVLPGEAFCDSCGADLTALAPAPVAVAAPTAAAAPAALAPPAEGQLVCAICGTVALPGERFCDNCGADLSAQVGATTPPVAPSVLPTEEPPVVPVPPTDGASGPPVEAPVVAEVPAVTAIPIVVEAEPPIAPAPSSAVAAAPSEAPGAVAAAPAPAPSEAPTPAAGVPALDQLAHAARRTELEAAIGRQQQIIAQFEQMQATFGAATPAAVTAGLAEAREALARVEAELAALGVSPPPAAPPAPAPTVVAPAPAPAAPAPATTGPRLVVLESGAELPLPLDKAEIIIGREDPVSNIFPEIDLTPHGGEMGGVSRHHARLTHAGGQWMLTDLNSTNYTRIDGVRLEPNVATPVHDGARLQFGRVVVTFHL